MKLLIISFKQHTTMPVLHHADLMHRTTELELRQVALPKKTQSYQPMPHGKVIDWVRQSCREHELEITKADFIQGRKGKQMAGLFYINPVGNTNPDLMYQLATLNSYDKTIRATVAGGAVVTVCSNGLLIADRSIKRMHRGERALGTIKSFIDDTLADHAATLEVALNQAEAMKLQPLSQREMAELAGRLFVEEKLLAVGELAELAREIDNPSFDYGGNNDSVWEFYNHVTHAIKKAPPIKYHDKHKALNGFAQKEFQLSL